MKSATPPEWVDAAEVFRRVTPDAARRLLRKALESGFDPADDPPRAAPYAGEGQLLIMPSSVGPATGVKVLSVAPNNPDRGLPRIQAWYVLMDSATLTPSVLLDGIALTALRTPATSMLAVEALAADDLDTVVFLGSGPQSLAHAEALLAIRTPRRAVLHARDPERAAATASRISELGLPCSAITADQLPDAVRSAQLVLACTSAKDPVLEGAWVADGTVVVAIGSHEPDRRELDSALMGRSLVVIEDVETALREAGDVVMAIDEGTLVGSGLRTLREVVLGDVGRVTDRPTVVKTVGMSWQDLVVAAGAARPADGLDVWGRSTVFDGAVNAHRVAPGLVRMGRREWVTVAGWRQAVDEGFRTVVDLRSDFEFAVRRQADAVVPDEVWDEITIVHCPTEDADDPRFDYPLGYLDHPRDYPRYLEDFGDRVARALLAVAHAEGPVIVHCSAGRDRTGLVLALGQLVAGWDRERIIDGYVRAAEGINDFQAHNPHPKETHKTGQEWAAWRDDRVAALRRFLDEVDAEGFLRAHGASDSDLAVIADLFAG